MENKIRLLLYDTRFSIINSKYQINITLGFDTNLLDLMQILIMTIFHTLRVFM